MSLISLGDLAVSFTARQSNARLKSELQRLATELTTGRTTDLRGVTGGDLAALAGVERGLTTLGAYKIAASEAVLISGALQRALETVQDTTTETGPALLLAATTREATLIQTAASDARARFATVVSALNTQVAGRTLLAGTGIGGAALADVETLMAGLNAAIATETTAAGVEVAIDAWFDTPGGGFETSGYLGNSATLTPFRIGPDTEVAITLTAEDQDLRDLMKGYALAAVVADGALSTDNDARVELIEAAGARLLISDTALAGLRAGIGMVQARIDTTIARNSAETTALEMALNEITAIDPYRAATDLQSVQTQLETLYTLTARLSRLSLAEYLR